MGSDIGPLSRHRGFPTLLMLTVVLNPLLNHWREISNMIVFYLPVLSQQLPVIPQFLHQCVVAFMDEIHYLVDDFIAMLFTAGCHALVP